jgi:hypothetical protein
MVPPAGSRYRAVRLRGVRRRRSVVLSQGAHARMGVPLGEGHRRATLRTIKRRSSPGAGLRRTTDARRVVGGDSEATTPDRHLEHAPGEPRDFVARPGNLQAWDPKDSYAV